MKLVGIEGAEQRAPKAEGVGFLGRRCPLPSRLGDLGERRELPQRGPGRSPGRQRILGIFQGLRSLLVENVYRIPCFIMTNEVYAVKKHQRLVYSVYPRIPPIHPCFNWFTYFVVVNIQPAPIVHREIFEIFHEIFHAKNFMKFYITIH